MSFKIFRYGLTEKKTVRYCAGNGRNPVFGTNMRDWITSTHASNTIFYTLRITETSFNFLSKP